MYPKNPLAGSRWIGTDAAPASCPVIKRHFVLLPDSLPADRRSADNGSFIDADLFITGLGYFSVTLNGHALTDDRFQPNVTDYEKREFTKITYPCRDSFRHRIYYCRYPAGGFLVPGENVLEITLGGGWYHQTERVAEGEMSYGDTLKTVFALYIGRNEIPAIVSDGSETWTAGEIVYSNLFIGECHDRTKTDTVPKPVTVLPTPDSMLTEQIGIPDRVIRRILPRKLHTVDGRVVYDAGENISGVVRVTKPDGCAVLRFAENLRADGSLDFGSTGWNYTCSSGKKQIMTDTFVGMGTFEPQFVWHGFRYFDVEGDIDMAEVLVIHSDTPVTSRFSSDNEGLNFLYDAWIRTQLDNMHGSIPSDCPHRERLGYTGDGQNCAEAAMMLLDTREFYRKWIRDIFDSQDKARGHIQHTAPFQGGGGGPGGWGCAAVIVPYHFWKQYGETALIREYYDGMRQWVTYLENSMENGLVVREEDGGWCLGDWCTLGKCEIPEPFVNTYFFVRSLRMLMEMAEAIGKTEDICAYRTLDRTMCDALIAAYADETGTHFCGGIQGADAYAVDIGIAGAQTAELLAEKYDRMGHFDTGFLGTDILLRVLFETGHADTAYRLLSAEERGSFLYMKRHGATTIWESWDGGGSHNHPMFGGCARFLFSYLLGIGQKTAGWEMPVIKPILPNGLDFIRGSMETVRSTFSVSLERHRETMHITVTTPCDAELVYGDKTVPLYAGTVTVIL